MDQVDLLENQDLQGNLACLVYQDCQGNQERLENLERKVCLVLLDMRASLDHKDPWVSLDSQENEVIKVNQVCQVLKVKLVHLDKWECLEIKDSKEKLEKTDLLDLKAAQGYLEALEHPGQRESVASLV